MPWDPGLKTIIGISKKTRFKTQQDYLGVKHMVTQFRPKVDLGLFGNELFICCL